ncbi:MAG: hypothetical protein DHS20C13_25150 [Thermodesulfobacteriota bacterium]|nr:MAG: hypothetical protein DHS20C13_25150 [Thermodesulfobacteriota bacterium]GJM36322.1 MAG: hypothetical protein DHS20C18_53230 [Saprospiraceae bacterium]
MKIAVSGTHRTGKTTLVEKLKEALPDYVCINEAYYQLEEAGHLFSEIPTVEDYILQLEYSSKQIVNSGENVIFDRCPVDMLAYLHAIDDLEPANVQSLYQSVQNVMAELDLLVFIPIEEPDLIGCPESALPELRFQVNDILNDWIWDFDVEVIEVHGALLTRRDQVMKRMLIT